VQPKGWAGEGWVLRLVILLRIGKEVLGMHYGWVTRGSVVGNGSLVTLSAP
jgi:hypothetical protein